MAHELTHALQDQTIGLDRWMKKGDKDLGEIKKDPTPEDIENDEMDDAREAVIEGQAAGHDVSICTRSGRTLDCRFSGPGGSDGIRNIDRWHRRLQGVQ